jgi:predicted transcriptional regulator
MAHLLQPQEVEVFYIIPGIKREVAICLKGKGMKQNKIAELLQIQGATVSQYLSSKRGNKIEFDRETLNEISKSSDLIVDKISYLRETQRLMGVIRRNGTLCRVHKLVSDVPSECEPGLVGCEV